MTEANHETCSSDISGFIDQPSEIIIYNRSNQQGTLSSSTQTSLQSKEDFLDLVSKGNIERCKKQLLDNPRIVNIKNTKGETPLHIAAINRSDSQMLLLLLKFKPNINARNFWGFTPLHYAAEDLSFKAIKALLQESGIDVNVRDANGYTVLHSYVSSSFSVVLHPSSEWIKGFRELIEAGLDVNAQTNYGNSILHLLSVRYGPSEEINEQTFLEWVLNECKDIKLDLKNNLGQTFMHSYIVFSTYHGLFEFMKQTGRAEELKELLNQPDVRGLSPFTMFLTNRNLPTQTQTEKLIHLGGSLKSVDNIGNTAMHNCAHYETLIGNGANVYSANIFGVSAFSAASMQAEQLGSDEDFSSADRWGRTPLFTMLNKEQLWRKESTDPSMRESLNKLMQFLTAKVKGFDINKQDCFGTTLLHLATYHDDSVAVEVLLNHGARTNIKDGEGDLPFHTAIRFGNVKSCRVFAEKCNIQEPFPKNAKSYKKPEMIYLSDVVDLNRLHKEVCSVPEEKEVFSRELLTKHFVNFKDETSEAKCVSSVVHDLVQRLCAEVSTYDARFTISVLQSGSSAEGTKVGLPDEFDFVLCLESLQNVCEIEMCEHPKFCQCGSLRFKNKNVPEEYLPFSDEEHFFISQPYLDYLFRYLQKALFKQSLWETGQLFFKEAVML